MADRSLAGWHALADYWQHPVGKFVPHQDPHYGSVKQWTVYTGATLILAHEIAHMLDNQIRGSLRRFYPSGDSWYPIAPESVWRAAEQRVVALEILVLHAAGVPRNTKKHAAQRRKQFWPDWADTEHVVRSITLQQEQYADTDLRSVWHSIGDKPCTKTSSLPLPRLQT